jgi:hypothetical protein
MRKILIAMSGRVVGKLTHRPKLSLLRLRRAMCTILLQPRFLDAVDEPPLGSE